MFKVSALQEATTMQSKSSYSISSLLVSGVLAFCAHAQEPNVTINHVVANVTNHSDGTSTVTLALTIHNQSDENVSNFRLLPLSEFGLQSPLNDQALEIDTIASGAILEQNWSLSSIGGLSGDSPQFDQLIFAAEAIDASQTLNTFPINSLRGTEQ